MKVLKFKCTLLSDVILNRKAATNGPNETLDFIPGSNILGIVASSLYPDSPKKQNNKEEKDSDDKAKLTMEEAWTLFHSGKVRFGDANPSVGNFRGLKVPASMYYPKLSKADKELYIHHHIPEKNNLGNKQLKQCRTGFYDFSSVSESGTARLIETFTNFAVKSAYDREERRAKDEQFFGYQSLAKDLNLYFSVELDDSEMSESECKKLSENIKKALIGNKFIGRSRSAQFGLINIAEADFSEIESSKPIDTEDGQLISVYADSRLIFLDNFGLPTFQPTPQQLLGIENDVKAEILWNKTQTRTFRYAPWNFKREYFDTDRCGIEKGSVFIIKISNEDKDKLPGKLISRYVGGYINEGFGKVIYNPSFLEAQPEGKAKVKLINSKNKPASSSDTLKEQTITTITDSKNPSVATSVLIKSLRKKRIKENRIIVHKIVNDWIENNLKYFQDDKFASQWGEIRNIASTSKDYGTLKKNLFEKSDAKGKGGYLSHGVAVKEKWSVHGRLEKFKTFVQSLDSSIALDVVVNLATEMAKKC